MRVWVISLLMLLAALAGCTDGGDADDDTSGDDVGDQDDPTDGTNGTDDAPNTAPTASLSANVTSGEAPFNVLFDFNGSDPDGDELNWTLDVDGDGTPDSEGIALPSNFTYTYDTAGTFNATLNVSDGEGANEAVVAITVEEASGDGGDVEEESGGQSVSGDWLVGAQNCPHVLALGNYEDMDPEMLAAGNGVFWGYFEVDPATIGTTWTLDKAGSPAAVEIELSFYATDGSYIGYTFEDSGQVPPDAGHGLVFPCDPGPGSFTYTAG